MQKVINLLRETAQTIREDADFTEKMIQKLEKIKKSREHAQYELTPIDGKKFEAKYVKSGSKLMAMVEKLRQEIEGQLNPVYHNNRNNYNYSPLIAEINHLLLD